MIRALDLKFSQVVELQTQNNRIQAQEILDEIISVAKKYKLANYYNLARNFSFSAEPTIFVDREKVLRQRLQELKKKPRIPFRERRESEGRPRCDFFLQLLLVGDAGVGKSSILQRYKTGKFKTNYKALDVKNNRIYSKMIEYKKGSNASLSVSELAGIENLIRKQNQFYKGTDGVLLVFDLTSLETFHNIKKWLDEIRKVLSNEITIILIRNKADLLDDIGESIDINNSKKYTKEYKIQLINTSAKTGLNIEEIFVELTNIIIANKRKSFFK